MASQLTRSSFLRLVVASSVALVLMMGYAAVHVYRFGAMTKPTGWTAVWKHGHWIVSTVDPAGPAAGKLLPLDQILAVNGDPRAERIGPSWYLRDRPSASYTVRVLRGEGEAEYRIDWPTHEDRDLQLWSAVHLLTGAFFLGIGLLIAFLRPDYFAARLAMMSGVTGGIFFVLIAMNRDTALLSGFSLVFTMMLVAVVPFHVLAGYRLSARFPTNEPSVGWWRGLEWCLLVGAFVVWLAGVSSFSVRATGPARAVEIASAYHPLPVYAELWMQPLGVVFGAVCGLVILAVCIRNYRRVREPDLRRRMRWMFVGLSSPMAPVILFAPYLLLTSSVRARLLLIHVVDALAILSPIFIAYAVFKHRVLGVGVVLRAGLQYLLAKNVLRIALVIPAVIIVATAVAHPGQTIGQLALGPFGKVDLLLLVMTGFALKYRTDLLERIDRHFFREAYRQDKIFLALGEAIRRAANVPEISRLLSSEIEDALHPRSIFAVSREGPEEFKMVYSSSQEGPRPVGDFGISAAGVDHLESPLDLRSVGKEERETFAALKSIGVELLVPIRGPNEGLVGLLLLGSKRSEEPYSGNDRRLLDTVAAQTGVAWENLQLRERLKREQTVRQRVVASYDGGTRGNMVMECPACGACYDGDAAICEVEGRALTPSLPISRTIDGKYALTQLIGRGGMGAVYKARDLRLDRTVAIKIMLGDLFGSSLALQRFSREARASAKVDHPNVVRVFDFGELPGGGAYLVLEYLQGVTLRRELHQRGALPPEEAAAMLLQIFHGVEAAHHRQVIHRDLKPENIFLVRESSSGTVAKILDFGLAAVRDLEFTDGKRLTQPGNFVGTLAYMSREQFLGREVDERTDVYSLAIVAFEMLTGEVRLTGPWFGQLTTVLQERLYADSSSGPHHAIAEVLERALAKDHQKRHASVQQFREALLPLLMGCPPLVAFSRAADDASSGSAETRGATKTQSSMAPPPDPWVTR
jgi:hypothetical protein